MNLVVVAAAALPVDHPSIASVIPLLRGPHGATVPEGQIWNALK